MFKEDCKKREKIKAAFLLFKDKAIAWFHARKKDCNNQDHMPFQTWKTFKDFFSPTISS